MTHHSACHLVTGHIALPLRRMNKKTNTFEYSDEGIGQAHDWLNQVYTENADLFKTVPILKFTSDDVQSCTHHITDNTKAGIRAAW